MCRPDVLWFLTVVVSLVGSVPTQEKEGPSRIQQLILGLRNDKTWDASATALVGRGVAVAKDLGTELRAASGAENQQLCDRLLTILQRLGLDGQGAVDDVFAVLPALDTDRMADAYLVLGSISPLGEHGRAADFKNTFVAVLTGANPQRGAERRRLMDGFSIGYSLATKKLQYRPDAGSKVAIEQVKLKTVTLPGVQLAQVFGADSYPLAKLFANHLQRFARNPVRVEFSKKLQRDRGRGPGFGVALAVSLTRIAKNQPEGALGLAYLLQHDVTEGLRRVAGRELMMTGPHLPAALPILREALKSPVPKAARLSPEVLCIVLNCVAMIGAPAKAHLPAIDELGTSPNKRVAARAAAAARRIRSACAKK